MGSRLRTFRRYAEDVHAWLSWWACFEENEGLWEQRLAALQTRMLRERSALAAKAKRELRQKRLRKRKSRRKGRRSSNRG